MRRFLNGRKQILLALMLSVFCISGLSLADTARRTRYMGTSNFTMPTGYTRSAMYYINDDSHTAALFSQAFFNNFMEVSFLRHMNGAEDGKNVMNLKVKLLEEDTLTPSVAWGVSDLNTQLGSKVFYWAGSKNIEAFGVKLHAGFFKDPTTTDHIQFYGIEKMIFPLVTIAAERVDGIDSIGLKLSPYPGVSIEFAQRNHKEEMYNLIYYRSF